MASIAKAEKKVEAMEASKARERAKKKAFKLEATEIAAAAGTGFARGYLKVKQPQLWQIAGGKLTLDHFVAVGGLALSFKGKGAAAAVGGGAGKVALAALTEEFGARTASA